MLKFKQYIREPLPLDESAAGEEWTEPLAGAQVAKHLNKSQIRGLLSDEDYTEHVKDPKATPVFRVKKASDTLYKVKAGNTKGEHHVEFTINNRGLITRKTVFRREIGLHPKLQWAIHSKWSLADELKKGKKK